MAIAFITGLILGAFLMAAIAVNHESETIDELMDINEKSLELANKYANRIVKARNKMESYKYYIPEDDKDEIIKFLTFGEYQEDKDEN